MYTYRKAIPQFRIRSGETKNKDFISRIMRKARREWIQCCELPFHSLWSNHDIEEPPSLFALNQRSATIVQSFATAKTMTTKATTKWCKTRRRNRNAAVGRKKLMFSLQKEHPLPPTVRVRLCWCCECSPGRFWPYAVLSGSVCRSWQNSN